MYFLPYHYFNYTYTYCIYSWIIYRLVTILSYIIHIFHLYNIFQCISLYHYMAYWLYLTFLYVGKHSLVYMSYDDY